MKEKLFALVAVITAGWQLTAMGQGAGQHLKVDAVSDSAAATLAYWTPERLQNAKPMELLSIQPNAAADGVRPVPSAGPPGFTSAQLPGFAPPIPVVAPRNGQAMNSGAAGIAPLGYPYPYPFTRFSVLSLLYDETIAPVFPYRAIGKLFFTIGTSNFVCSAQVARPHLVLTARHCIYDVDTGTFATNVVFFPGWHSGANPTLGGGWLARTLITWGNTLPATQWDIGFIQTFDDDGIGCGGSALGRPIETYTGLLGTTWDGTYDSRHWDEFGYPAAAPFNGQILIQSESSTGALDQFGQLNTVEVGNDQTGGSSGGAWILGFDPAGASVPPANPGGNLANGVNSFKFVARPLAMNSPQFLDANFNQLRLAAEALPCP
jgi:hypothetical protein